MSSTNDAGVCDVCNRGIVVQKMQEIAFHQWTTKGNVFCRVTVALTICSECGASSSNEAAEAIIEEAVKREIDKLP
jgi:hypothetical protein